METKTKHKCDFFVFLLGSNDDDLQMIKNYCERVKQRIFLVSNAKCDDFMLEDTKLYSLLNVDTTHFNSKRRFFFIFIFNCFDENFFLVYIKRNSWQRKYKVLSHSVNAYEKKNQTKNMYFAFI